MRKILFIDVDGTLVDYENKLPDSAVTAIRKGVYLYRKEPGGGVSKPVGNRP